MNCMLRVALVPAMAALMASAAVAAPVYLNQDLITVEIGGGTSPGTWNNTFNGGQTINKVIDAPSADAEEIHDQSTHIWFTADTVGGGAELLFNFKKEYDITTLHFWNYTAESFDVDQVDFTFFNGSNIQVGALSVNPALGTSPGIKAEDIALAAPLNVQYVTAFLTGTNRQVDFQNIGFTATVSQPSTVPLPAGLPLLASGLALYALVACRRRAA